MTAAAIFMIDMLVVLRMQKGAVVSSFVSVALCTAISPMLIELFGMNGVSLSISLSYVICCLCSLCIFFYGVRKRKGRL